MSILLIVKKKIKRLEIWDQSTFFFFFELFLISDKLIRYLYQQYWLLEVILHFFFLSLRLDLGTVSYLCIWISWFFPFFFRQIFDVEAEEKKNLMPSVEYGRFGHQPTAVNRRKKLHLEYRKRKPQQEICACLKWLCFFMNFFVFVSYFCCFLIKVTFWLFVVSNYG